MLSLTAPLGPSTAKALSCLPSPAASCRSQHLLDCVVLCSPSSGNCHIHCEQPARTSQYYAEGPQVSTTDSFLEFFGTRDKGPWTVSNLVSSGTNQSFLPEYQYGHLGTKLEEAFVSFLESQTLHHPPPPPAEWSNGRIALGGHWLSNLQGSAVP